MLFEKVMTDSSKPLDMFAVENALIDILYKTTDDWLEKFKLTKGTMRLVDLLEQQTLLSSLEASSYEIEAGGSAANALRGFALLGGKCSYSSMIGDDFLGKRLSSRLDELGIGNFLAKSKTSTGSCIVMVSPDGERTMNTHLGACRHYTANDLPLEEIKKAKIFFTTGYMWDTPEQIEAVQKGIKFAKESGSIVALDVADPFVISRSKDYFNKLIKDKMIDILFANEEESKMLCGKTDADAAKHLSGLVECVVVKAGSRGAFIGSPEGIIPVKAYPPKKVVDTTGAGDMFAGGFLYGISQGLSLEQCGLTGSIMASDVIAQIGVRLSGDVLKTVKENLK